MEKIQRGVEEERERENEKEEAGISCHPGPVYPKYTSDKQARAPQLCGTGDQHHPDSKLLSPLLHFGLEAPEPQAQRQTVS